jgi:hypothetical protein
MRSVPAAGTLATVVLALTLGLSGCGGDDDETSPPGARAGAADPVAAVEAWVAAYGEPDAAAACALQTDDYTRHDLASAAEQQLVDPDATCEEGVTVGNQLSETFGIDFATAEVTLLEKDDDTATVQVRFSGVEPTDYDLVKVDGGWLIDAERAPAGKR